MANPVTLGQRLYHAHLINPKVQLLVVTGPSGSGKTLMASRAGAFQTVVGKYKKMVITRPTVTVDDEEHGFLPGSLDKKMSPWVKPVTDYIDRMENKIEISPLAYMRGLTFENSWIIADEMQNSSKNQMKMMLTRMGKNSKIIVTGDVSQSDRMCDGLNDLVSRLRKGDLPESIKLVELSEDDVVRSELVKHVLKLYSN